MAKKLNAWQKFQKAHKGRKLTAKKLAKMYAASHGKAPKKGASKAKKSATKKTRHHIPEGLTAKQVRAHIRKWLYRLARVEGKVNHTIATRYVTAALYQAEEALKLAVAAYLEKHPKAAAKLAAAKAKAVEHVVEQLRTKSADEQAAERVAEAMKRDQGFNGRVGAEASL